jgi:hypothetical protein
MPATTAGLQLNADRALPPTGTIGYFLLVDGDLLTNGACTANETTNEITTTTPHGLVPGTRVRIITSGGTLPGPLSAATDYYVAVVSASVLQLCATLADAIAATPIPVDLTSQGSNLALNEQLLLPTDRKEVILNHECSGNNYSRYAVTNIGTSIIGLDGKARKNPTIWGQQALGGSISFKHIAFLDGGTAVVGNTTGILSYLVTNTNITTIADTVVQALAFQLGCEN